MCVKGLCVWDFVGVEGGVRCIRGLTGVTELLVTLGEIRSCTGVPRWREGGGGLSNGQYFAVTERFARKVFSAPFRQITLPPISFSVCTFFVRERI